ncbi:DUF2975 domain-containing protein [Massilia glaciei]|uniref:DUF2975 domain-containing protein n=2 Tax=Massilia glaciei TaxID=1524097 RepID=A0A2U2I4V2_9BURK|nr:DUF2975 domain-containing protein [Massilia glaciei]
MQCRVIRILLAVCVFLQVAFFVLAWSSLLPAHAFMQMSADGISVEAMRALPMGQRLAGAALALPVLGALSYGMWRLERMLANVGRRAVFDLANIEHLRAFAGATLLATLWSIAAVPLRALAFRHGFGDPAPGMSISVSAEVVLLIFVCALFYLVTGMMHEGRRLAEENAGFV